MPIVPRVSIGLALTRFWIRSSVDDVGRGVEDRPDRAAVAQRPVEAEVRAEFRMDLRRGRVEAGGEVGVARLHPVVDLDQVGRSLRCLQGFGDDRDHWVADMVHAVADQHGMLGGRHRRAVGAVDRPGAGQAADPGFRQVVTGEDVEDAGM